MNLENPVVLGVVGAVVATLVLLVTRLYILTKRLNSSFAKLGFIVREDAKKYFDDAAEKIVATNKQFQGVYQQIVEDGTKKVLMDSGVVMEKAIADAQQEAGKVIMRAHDDAQHIISEATKQADAKLEQSLQRAVDTIGWAMEQYLKEHYSVADHEEHIEKLVDLYVNEHRN